MVNIKNRHKGKSKQKSTPNGADRNKKSQTKKQFIGDIDEAPDFLKDNEYILTGYRIGFNDFKSAIKSLFMYHNETTNVWTHFIGVMLFFGLMLYI